MRHFDYNSGQSGEHVDMLESLELPPVWEYGDEVDVRHRHYMTGGFCSFYPLYSDGSKLSYSPLALARRRGHVVLDNRSSDYISKYDMPSWPPSVLIDRDLKRLGGPDSGPGEISDSETYVAAMADAIRMDAAEAEGSFPDWTNIIMCGGKDSLNLLLLPWKNPVLVVSGEPNYPLVVEFIQRNSLNFDCLRLSEDVSDDDLRREIVINMCRTDLQHVKWTPHLTRLARDHNGRCLFWRGELGGILLVEERLTARRFAERRRGRAPHVRLRRRIEREVRSRRGISGNDAEKLDEYRSSLWMVGAQLQGVNCGMTQELSGAPHLSGYHGPATSEVLRRADQMKAVRGDLRPVLGKILHGGDVRYPEPNPSPPHSTKRRGISDLGTFVSVARSFGLDVRTSL